MPRKPRILLVGGFHQWAYEFKSDALIRHLSHRYRLEKFFSEDSHDVPHEEYDAVYVFYWLSTDYLRPIPHHKLAGGVTSHRRLSQLSPGRIAEVVARFRIFTANSKLLADHFRGYRPDIVYTPNGVDIERFHPRAVPRDRHRPFTVGWVGDTGTPEKHFDDIVQPLRAVLPGVRFAVATRRAPRPHEDMPAFYRGCDCLLVASDMDGTPNPALEAGACGVPVIANRIGNMPELIEDGANGFLVELELEAYRERISYLARRRRLAARMGARLRADIERGWGWERRARRYDALFAQLLA
jgi:glycosyltransferase involved in cell wall biosynthesis